MIIAIPLGASDTSFARHTVGMLKDALDWQKTKLVATVLAPGTFGLGAVRRHTDVLATAHRAGREAVESLNLRKGVKNAL